MPKNVVEVSMENFTLPINLDGMTIDPQDYLQFIDWLCQQQIYSIGEKSRRLLAQYATSKSQALIYRLEGKILQASYQEAKCQEIYTRLPKKWRW
jgi:hypothetical protein